MASARQHFARMVSAGAALTLLAGGARAAESSLTAHLGTRLAHSDNVALATEGNEQAEEIAELTAGIKFDRSEQRQETHISYEAHGVFYNESSESNEVLNTLDAQSRWALVLDRFFVDLFAVYDQTLVDATAKYSFNRLALTGNRTDVAILGVSPNIALAIGDNVVGEVRVGNTGIDYDDEELEDNTERIASFNLGNSNARAGGSWQVRYVNEDFDYEVSPKVHIETFELELGYWAGPTVKLFTVQGLESDYSLVGVSGTSPGLDEHFWYVGADWKPSERNSLSLSSGERTYGDAYRFSWRYKAAHGGVSMGYTEEPSTFLREQLNSVRSVGELSEIDSLDGPNGNLFYLLKRYDVVFLLERPRSSAALRFFDEERFDIVDSVNDIKSQTEEFHGTEVSLSWTLGSRAKIAMSVQAALRRSTVQVVDDELKYLSILYERRVGRQGALTVNFGRERSKPRSGLAVENEYTENQLSFALRRWFGSAPSTAAPKRFSSYLDAPTTY